MAGGKGLRPISTIRDATWVAEDQQERLAARPAAKSTQLE